MVMVWMTSRLDLMWRLLDLDQLLLRALGTEEV